MDRAERQRAENAVCGDRATVGITTSLWGAGGFGKTTLAEMVCATSRVREHYKGGVYSFTLGRGLRGRTDIAARVAEITAFIRPIPSLLPAGTQTIQVDQMTLDQARTVLTWELDGLPPLATGVLLGATGRRPLLLRLVNRQIKTHIETGRDPARAAEEMLDQLRVHGPQGADPTGAAMDMDHPGQRRRAIRATVEAASGLLPGGGMERFAELAIFAEDESVPLPLIARLWQVTGGLNERESRALCALLAGPSLLSLTRDNDGRISLHDVIRDYLLSAQNPTRLAALHGQLVDAAADDLLDAAPPSAHTRTPYPATLRGGN